MKQYKSSDKTMLKMTREGAVMTLTIRVRLRLSMIRTGQSGMRSMFVLPIHMARRIPAEQLTMMKTEE